MPAEPADQRCTGHGGRPGPQAPSPPQRPGKERGGGDRGAGQRPGQPEGLENEVFQTWFTSKPEGTGLGLPICRSFIEGKGGKIWAERNAPEPGTTFVIRLPAGDSA
ncbi:ATP-binding protein [Thiohalorhabdus methylotrophus]|uniref:histidine kinase n=1 Tax=Thiohalorhabdus methylotrophus TaxID=3242694 RepID=A0ABV4TRD8_9GAMM